MFKFLREKFQLWVYDQYQSGRDLADQRFSHDGLSRDEEYDTSNISHRGTRFEIHNANGGLIIEIDRMDEPNSLYIIRDDDDLGNSLSKIITIERLKQ